MSEESSNSELLKVSPPAGGGDLPAGQAGLDGALGVIIHENRFTYEQKGLHKIVDLGDYWEKQTTHPIPLGGIVIKREIDDELKRKIDRLIKQSIEYAYTNYPELNDYIRSHSQEMSEDVMRRHIDLYVNNYSLDLGEDGKNAVKKLLEVYGQVNTCSINDDDIFIK